jgi:multidrug efflux pump subunit AcrA (membrane-fusion protein)
MSRLSLDRPARTSTAAAQNNLEPASKRAESSAPVPTVKPKKTWHRRLLGRAPTLLVIGMFIGLAIYGHLCDWKLPKFSALAGADASKRDDWCESHGVPESKCVQCRPELLPGGKDFGWCNVHGIQDCPLCHPEVAQLKETPTVSEADLKRSAGALAFAPRQENNGICKNYRRIVQFATHEAVLKAGVDVKKVDRGPVVESVSANGEIAYDETRFASLSSRLPGTVWRVEKNVGDRVRAGEVLALVDAAEVGQAKTELIQALAKEALQQDSLKRLESIADIVSGRQIQEAQGALYQARARLLSAQQSLGNLGLTVNVDSLRGMSEEKLSQNLRLLGIPEQLAERFNAEETTANLLPIKAPLDGVVVARQAVAGEVVDASRVIFQLADVSRMWLTLNVSVADAARLALGQPVRFRPDGSKDEIQGTLIWISTTADQQTRMVTVRSELLNPNGQLRNKMFGSGRIILREESEAIVVPKEAVHTEGCCQLVFVRDKRYFDKDSPKVFHVRTVRVGGESEKFNEKFTEILAGVLPGEVVATKGSDVLRAELSKNNLGEGCCGR